MIEAAALSKRFGTIQAVREVSFRAANGEITGLLGPNGAGKSTTLRMLYGVVTPDRGCARIDDLDIRGETSSARAHLGVLPHAAGLYGNLTGRENIAYFGALHGIEGGRIEARIAELGRALDMQSFLERRAKGFSQGQRIKVALARALIHEPANLVLDEPTNGLDVMAIRNLRDILRDLKTQGRCILFSSHVMQEVAALCDQVVIIGQGSVLAQGSPEALRAASGAASLEEAFLTVLGESDGRLMRALVQVFRKEFLENLRDRRTLISALLFGPLFGPLLFGAMVSRMLNQSVIESDEPLKIEIAGAERAPNLTSYLESHGVQCVSVQESEAAAREAVRRGAAAVVLIVAEDYAERFSAARPAPLLLIADSSDSQTRKSADRLRALIAGYGSAIAQQRLEARGVDPLLGVPVAIQEVDATTPAGRAVVVLGFMTYFVLFAVLMGGLYLAIDSTAGERERGSLEALLSLPVARSALVGGKMLATSAYMCLSLAVDLAAFVCVLRFVPLERLGMSANLGARTALEFFAICVPFVPLGAALMMLVASFTRSYREAQTYLTSVLLVPTLPIAFASIYSLKTKSSLMLVPSLSQHLLMTSILKDEPIAPLDVAVSASSALALAALLFVLTARHWRRETMLG